VPVRQGTSQGYQSQIESPNVPTKEPSPAPGCIGVQGEADGNCLVTFCRVSPLKTVQLVVGVGNFASCDLACALVMCCPSKPIIGTSLYCDLIVLVQP
jgi:hypothetical protein